MLVKVDCHENTEKLKAKKTEKYIGFIIQKQKLLTLKYYHLLLEIH